MNQKTKHNPFKNKLMGRKILRWLSALLITIGVATHSVWGQSPQIRTSVNADGRVFIYATQPPKSGQGYHYYRQDANGKEVRLSGDEPIRGVQNGAELLELLGDDFNTIRETLREDDPSAMLFKLRADRISGNLYAFSYPTIAIALGQLWVDSTATLGQTVTYRLETLNLANKPVGRAITRNIKVQPDIPVAPQELKAEAKGREIKLSWRFPTANEDQDDKVMQFHLYRALEKRDREGREMFEKINPSPIIRNANATTGTYTWIAGPNASRETFFVVAQTISGQLGGQSETTTITLTDNIPPDPLPGVTIVAYRDGSLQLTWPQSLTPDAVGYHLLRSPRFEDGYEKCLPQTLPLTQTTYTDRKDLISGKAYYYSIVVVDAAGNESERSNPVMEMVKDQVPPPTPKSLKADLQPNKDIVLTWSGEEVTDLKTYVVLRKRVARGVTAWTQISRDSLKTNQFTDVSLKRRGLEEGAAYDFAVSAVDYALNFSDTTFVNLKIPDLTPPEAPTQISAANQLGRYINVSWGNSPSTDVVQYQLFRSENNSPEKLLATLKEAFYFRDEAISQPNTYRYSVVAVDSLGNVSKPKTSETVTANDLNPPREVRNVRAFPREGFVELIWEPVVANDLTKYRIYRSDTLPTGIYTQIAEVDTQTLTFRDPAGQKKHWYRLTAVDNAGNESRQSEPARPFLRTD
ncbi:MAG: hypothetical protein J0L94_05535 [Rhodothermia bacterium]|nr:hypothetical protein [Rhodothermia bacterium]